MILENQKKIKFEKNDQGIQSKGDIVTEIYRAEEQLQPKEKFNETNFEFVIAYYDYFAQKVYHFL